MARAKLVSHVSHEKSGLGCSDPEQRDLDYPVYGSLTVL